MHIDISRTFTPLETPDKVVDRAREWAAREGWKTLTLDDRRIVAQRGGGLWCWFTFDVCKLPTTVTIEITGQGPYECTVRYEVGHIGQFETPRDRKRVEDQLALITARMKGAV